MTVQNRPLCLCHLHWNAVRGIAFVFNASFSGSLSQSGPDNAAVAESFEVTFCVVHGKVSDVETETRKGGRNEVNCR